MGFQDLLKHAPVLTILWIISLVLMGMVFLLFLLQEPHINKIGRDNILRNLGTAMDVSAILICVVGMIWVVAMTNVMRNSRNIWADTSSIYVSRSNLLLNWFTNTPPTLPAQTISGATAPADKERCFINFQSSTVADPYQNYRALIKAYEGGGKVTQYYQTPEPASGAFQFTKAEEDMGTQQRLSLAYYRYAYCTQSYFQDVVNGNWGSVSEFLPKAVVDNLKSKKSNCLAASSIPDTQACVDGGNPVGGQCIPNLCFLALNESIAAQCLLYDDHVYKGLNNGSAKGVLDAFELTGHLVQSAPAV